MRSGYRRFEIAVSEQIRKLLAKTTQYIYILKVFFDVKTITNVTETFVIRECFQLNSIQGFSPFNGDPGDLLILGTGGPCTSNCVTQTQTPTSTKTPTPTTTTTLTITPTTQCRASVTFTVLFTIELGWVELGLIEQQANGFPDDFG
jgi:hypothetical protein